MPIGGWRAGDSTVTLLMTVLSYGAGDGEATAPAIRNRSPFCKGTRRLPSPEPYQARAKNGPPRDETKDQRSPIAFELSRGRREIGANAAPAVIQPAVSRHSMGLVDNSYQASRWHGYAASRTSMLTINSVYIRGGNYSSIIVNC
jgi:hypothetical protein